MKHYAFQVFLRRKKENEIEKGKNPMPPSPPPEKKRKATDLLYLVIWGRIATFLQDSDVISLAKVSIDINDACDSDVIWKPIADEAEAILQIEAEIISPNNRQNNNNNNNNSNNRQRRSNNDDDDDDNDDDEQKKDNEAVPYKPENFVRGYVRKFPIDLWESFTNVDQTAREVSVSPSAAAASAATTTSTTTEDENNKQQDFESSSSQLLQQYKQQQSPNISSSLESALRPPRIEDPTYNSARKFTTTSGKSKLSKMVRTLQKRVFSKNNNKNSIITSSLHISCAEFQRYYTLRLIMAMPVTAAAFDVLELCDGFLETPSTINSFRFNYCLVVNCLVGGDDSMLDFFRAKNSRLDRLIQTVSSFKSKSAAASFLFHTDLLRFARWNSISNNNRKTDDDVNSLIKNYFSLLIGVSSGFGPDHFDRSLRHPGRRRHINNNNNNNDPSKGFLATLKNNQRNFMTSAFYNGGILRNPTAYSDLFRFQRLYFLTKFHFDASPWLFDGCVKLSRELDKEVSNLSSQLLPNSSEGCARGAKCVLTFVFSIGVIFGASFAELLMYIVWPEYLKQYVQPPFAFIKNMTTSPFYAFGDVLTKLAESKSADIEALRQVISPVVGSLVSIIFDNPICSVVISSVFSFFSSSSSSNDQQTVLPGEETWWQKFMKPVEQFPAWEHSGLYMMMHWPNDLKRSAEEEAFYSSNSFDNYVLPAVSFSILFLIGVYTSKKKRSTSLRQHEQRRRHQEQKKNNNNKHYAETPSSPLPLRILLAKHAADTFFDTLLLLSFIPLEYALYMPSSYTPVAVLPLWLEDQEWYKTCTNFLWKYLLGEDWTIQNFYMSAATELVLSGSSAVPTSVVDQQNVSITTSNSSSSSMMMTIPRGGPCRFNVFGMVVHQLCCWGLMGIVNPVEKLMRSDTFSDSILDSSDDDDDDFDEIFDTDEDDSSFGGRRTSSRREPFFRAHEDFKKLSDAQLKNFARTTNSNSSSSPSKDLDDLVYQHIVCDKSKIHDNQLNNKMNKDYYCTGRAKRMAKKAQAEREAKEKKNNASFLDRFVTPIKNFCVSFFYGVVACSRLMIAFTRKHGSNFVSGYLHSTCWFLLGFGVRFCFYRRCDYSLWISAVLSTVGLRVFGGVLSALWDLYDIGYFTSNKQK